MTDLILAQFSVTGRTSRQAFLKLWLRLCYLSALNMIVGVFLASQGVKLAGYVAIGLEAVLITFNFATMVKRFHDRNRSGWWLGALFLIVVGSYFAKPLQKNWPGAFIFLMLALLIANLWLLIELFFRRGTKGANRFGEDPSEASAR